MIELVKLHEENLAYARKMIMQLQENALDEVLNELNITYVEFLKTYDHEYELITDEDADNFIYRIRLLYKPRNTNDTQQGEQSV